MEKKEAMKMLKEFRDKSALFSVRPALDTIIPELKESEDETIRKELISFLEGFYANKNKDRWIAWLEKQGENHIVENNEMVKSADKIEPKFKVGDWIVYEGLGTYKVVGIHEEWYSVIDINDYCWSVMFERESLCHIWTIKKDAKDGDVLMANAPFIFNGNLEGGMGCPGAHCAINTLGKFQIPKYPEHWTGHSTTPATKEQRDLLFQKMKEAGYEWDADNKELKQLGRSKVTKISEQVWSEEDERCK